MALDIKTFSNTGGGEALFKALGHPLAQAAGRKLADWVNGHGKVVIYDPNDQLGTALQYLELKTPDAVLVQSVEALGRTIAGCETRPVTELPEIEADLLFVAGFDADKLIQQIRHLIPAGMATGSLDAMRIPDALLTNRKNYLAPINFATNFAFFREAKGHHTRIVTANYWSAYGASEPKAWCMLFDEAGKPIAEWTDPLPPANGTIAIDSAAIKKRFSLPDFTGQLFIHIVGAAGHEVVKYALDTYGDSATVLSCTHDANAWPSETYAGLPAPADGETVVLWLQNSHSVAIPPGGIGLNRMGDSHVAWLHETIPPFATRALSVAELLPELSWPAQIEVQAGKHVVRPRYEVTRAGRQRIAHVNVQRHDLNADPKIPAILKQMGKGYILPAPLFDPDRYETWAMPTPMATHQADQPLTLIIYNAKGHEVHRRFLGRLPRNHDCGIEISAILKEIGRDLGTAHGHIELIYDFREGGTADGWLHGLFRYIDKKTGHGAETSFGSHIFNTVLTYKNEPQSYAGKPPGLTTRLFLRLGPQPYDSFCQLIYPASTPWHAVSDTKLILHDKTGTPVAEKHLAIPQSGSAQFRYHDTFTAGEREKAGEDAYVLIRDTTCRLFGYHGLVRDGHAFSLDHMFGF